jgi:putative Holliday junction resolvase
MKYLGIDYGTKKIGLAISDARGLIAFPKIIIPSNNTSIDEIAKMINDEGIEKIVIGYSVGMDGSENSVQKKIDVFQRTLAEKTGIIIDREKEWMSSVAARSHLYGKGNIANEQWSEKQNTKRREDVDAGAAAIILQRYLDKNLHQKTRKL